MRSQLSYYFPASVPVLTLGFMAAILGIFIFNVNDSFWSRVGGFYALTAILALVAILFVFFLSPNPFVESKNNYYIFIGFFSGLGVLTLLNATVNIQSTANFVDILRIFEVALTEEFAYRFAFPAFFAVIFAYSRVRHQITFFDVMFAMLISNTVFAFFHLIAYDNNIEQIFIALVAGLLQSLVIILLSNRSPSVFVGVVVGHFAWDLSSIASNWLEISLFLLLVFYILFELYSVKSVRL